MKKKMKTHKHDTCTKYILIVLIEIVTGSRKPPSLTYTYTYTQSYIVNIVIHKTYVENDYVINHIPT